MPEYSVMNPATSSDSVSGRSKGARFVSARMATKKTMKAGNHERVPEDEPVHPEEPAWCLTDLDQVEAAGDHQGHEEATPERNLVGDDLGRLAHRAVERPLRVRGPAGHDNADRRRGSQGEDEEDPQVDVREEELGLRGKAAIAPSMRGQHERRRDDEENAVRTLRESCPP